VGLFDDLSELVSRNARRLFRFSTLASIPSTIAMTRRFMNSINWKQAQADIEGELQRKVAILGLPNSGKSTLFNTLRGYYASAVSATPGTTTSNVQGNLGPFALVDTPGHLPDIQAQAAAEAPIVLYLLDASAGLRAQDLATISNLRDDGKTLIVALNKADLLTHADDDAAKAAARLGLKDVIPISARDGDNVAEELIPALIEASPEAALILGRQLPKYRREAASRLVRNAALVGLAAGLEPIPLIDIPILLGNQIRMVLRIAAIYGEPLTARHGRELITTAIGGLFFRYVAEELAKIVPFGGDLVAGAIAAAGTWSLGMVAIEYFESGKKLRGDQLRDMFDRLYQKYRAQGDGTATKGQPAPSPLAPNAIVIDQDPPSANVR
jgi:small GTP-binding protein